MDMRYEDLLNFGNNQNQLSAPVGEQGGFSGLANIGQSGGLGGSGLGFNVGTGQLLLGGLGALGNLWTAWNATDLAKKQFNFQKDLATANYANQAQSYNTRLEDRAYARYAMQNQSPSDAAAYINGHRLNPMLPRH